MARFPSRSADGRILLACSYDGSVRALFFDAEELGTRVAKAEVVSIGRNE